MNEDSLPPALRRFAAALDVEAPVRTHRGWYELSRFREAPAFPCEPLPVHWDGPTTAAVCVRLDLAAVPDDLRARIEAAAADRIGADGALYLLVDAAGSQHRNRRLALEELERLSAPTPWSRGRA